MIDTGISVYAGLEEYSLDNNSKYLVLAKEKGCEYVFSSAHINEAKTSTADLQNIIDKCLKLGLKLSLDISKPAMSKLNLPEGIYALRLDYGFSDEEIINYSNNASFLVELNASTISKEHLESLIKNGLNTKKTRFSFNFYPKLYTGHDILYIYEMTKTFKKYGIYVAAFIPSHFGFRPPMYEGLPSVENHRKMSLEKAIEELKACGVDGIYFGDAYAAGSELELLNRHKCEELLIVFDNSIKSEEVENLFYKSFKIRPDLNSYLLRIGNTRIEENINCINNVSRTKYDVTMDNSLFKRYKGEINIVLTNLEKDDRVNVIGKIDSTDIIVDGIKRGMKFKFIKKGW